MEERIKCETYSRITGYIRPVSSWNNGKQQELSDRNFINDDGHTSGN